MSTTPRRPRSRRMSSWLLAATPALSGGFLTPLPFLHSAVRHRSWKSAAAAVTYTAATVGEWVATTAPDNSTGDNIGCALFMGLVVVGTAHAFVWRETLPEDGQGDGSAPELLPTAPCADDDTAQTVARLRRSLERATTVADECQGFPARCRPALAGVVAAVEQVLDFCEGGGRADAQLRGVEVLVTDYLPTSLDTYVRLPARLARTRLLSNGRTAARELELQLQWLRSAAADLAAALYDRSAQDVLEQSAFLRDRFGGSELDLAHTAAVDVLAPAPASPSAVARRAHRPHPKTRH